MGESVTLLTADEIDRGAFAAWVATQGGYLRDDAPAPRAAGGFARGGVTTRFEALCDARREGLDEHPAARERLGAAPRQSHEITGGASWEDELGVVDVAARFAARWRAVGVCALHRVLDADALAATELPVMLGSRVDVYLPPVDVGVVEGAVVAVGGTLARAWSVGERAAWADALRARGGRAADPARLVGGVSARGAMTPVTLEPAPPPDARDAAIVRCLGESPAWVARVYLGHGADDDVLRGALDLARRCIAPHAGVARLLVEETLDAEELAALRDAGLGLSR